MKAESLSLTQQAQQFLKLRIPSGAVVVDATAGNGQDTLFLANCVGENGCVYALDIQLSPFFRSLSAAKPAVIRFHQVNHSLVWDWLAAEHQGCLAAVLFNLGYLPGGDHSLVTTSAGTQAALASAYHHLQPGGWLSVLAYRGHPGGQEECQCVEDWLNKIRWQTTETIDSLPGLRPGPKLFLRQKAR